MLKIGLIIMVLIGVFVYNSVTGNIAYMLNYTVRPGLINDGEYKVNDNLTIYVEGENRIYKDDYAQLLKAYDEVPTWLKAYSKEIYLMSTKTFDEKMTALNISQNTLEHPVNAISQKKSDSSFSIIYIRSPMLNEWNELKEKDLNEPLYDYEYYLVQQLAYSYNNYYNFTKTKDMSVLSGLKQNACGYSSDGISTSDPCSDDEQAFASAVHYYVDGYEGLEKAKAWLNILPKLSTPVKNRYTSES